ncbi:hypothetical protein [Vibrio renipiscarius]|uniref:hypothetical protein n=1 Tax=Vibrio renipiscarius TaxID=1461322 RepID=UPI0013634597|nr:hypothetical protein [Vibrio renipiscarius]
MNEKVMGVALQYQGGISNRTLIGLMIAKAAIERGCLIAGFCEDLKRVARQPFC